MLQVNIGTGLSTEIIIGAAILFFSGGLVLRNVLRPEHLFLVCSIKVLIPLLYFIFFFEPSWCLNGDDEKYINGALALKNIIVTNINNADYFSLLDFKIAWHFITSLWFLSSFYIFGYYYWAPIFLAVFFSFLTMLVLYRMLIANGFGRTYAGLCVVFYGLHPYIISWTSFVALRESLAGFLLLWMLYMALGFIRGNINISVKNIILFLLVSCAIYNVRYYLIFNIVAASVMFIFLFRKEININRIFISGSVSRWAMFFVLIFAIIIIYNYFFYPDKYIKTLIGVPFGMVKWFLSPSPFSLSDEYTFLLVAATFHVLLFFPSLLSLPDLWKRSMLFRFLVLNLIIASAVYAAVGLGIRQRYQYEVVLILLQFHFLVSIRKSICRNE